MKPCVKNTFAHFQEANVHGEPSHEELSTRTKSDSELDVLPLMDKGGLRTRPRSSRSKSLGKNVEGGCAFSCHNDDSSAPEHFNIASGTEAHPKPKKLKPGRRERQGMKEEQRSTSQSFSEKARAAVASSKDKCSYSVQRVHAALGALIEKCTSKVRQGLSMLPKVRHMQTPLGPTMLLLALMIGLVCMSLRLPSKVDASLAEAMMVEHSQHMLKASTGIQASTLEALQDKLQLNKMHIDMDTQIFTATRDKAQDIILAMCELPEKVCKSMVAALSTEETKFHKKRSIPLDDNQGSYHAVWMWVRSVGDKDKDQIEVAFKVVQLSYKLRDVVTYKDQTEEEPVVRCDTTTRKGWFADDTESTCKQVSTKRTVTAVPVFKQAIMNPNEMHLVDTIMERMLSEKVLANIKGGSAQGAVEQLSADPVGLPWKIERHVHKIPDMIASDWVLKQAHIGS